jgi:hypothetical protein
MSLDRDASDRTFDRQLAHLGLLDDAAPLFREGSSIPGVGVLVALPCLVESGLFRISRKLYGEIGPAFYGLRLLMALLRIKRPEHLKERDPAAFGRLLGRTHAAQALCEMLDQTATIFPGSRLRVRFATRPPPRIGLAFPGSPADRGTAAALAR